MGEVLLAEAMDAAKAAEWWGKLPAEGPEAKTNENGAGTNTEDTDQE